MAWIEFHLALRDHWKVKRLAGLMGVDYAHALGRLACLWCWTAQNAPKGNLSDFSDEELCDGARISATLPLKNYLKQVKLLDANDRIHDWGKHGLKLLESNRKRVAEYRKKKRDCNVTVMPTNLTNHTIPNQPINTMSGKPDFSQPILYLNEKTGRNYDHKSQSNLKFVMARFKAGKTFSDFKTVIDKKVAEWKGTEWEIYLRPETLFNATKFESYLNQPIKETPEFQHRMKTLGVK
jgi:uncharacterized phage protein (TIGR02220 family)